MTSSSNGNGKKSPFDGRAFRRQLMKQGMFVRNPINDKDSLALMDEHGTGYSTVGECLKPGMPLPASLCCSKQLQGFQRLVFCKRPSNRLLAPSILQTCEVHMQASGSCRQQPQARHAC